MYYERGNVVSSRIALQSALNPSRSLIICRETADPQRRNDSHWTDFTYSDYCNYVYFFHWLLSIGSRIAVDELFTKRSIHVGPPVTMNNWSTDQLLVRHLCCSTWKLRVSRVQWAISTQTRDLIIKFIVVLLTAPSCSLQSFTSHLMAYLWFISSTGCYASSLFCKYHRLDAVAFAAR